MSAPRSAFEYLLEGEFESFPLIDSVHSKINQNFIVQMMDKEDPKRPWHRLTVAYESTNIILADSYSEIEQLRRRKDDHAFLELYLDYMGSTCKFESFPNILALDLRGFSFPREMIHYPGNLVKAWIRHTEYGIWDKLPGSVTELNERVDFILENTIIDEHPVLRYPPQVSPAHQNRARVRLPCTNPTVKCANLSCIDISTQSTQVKD